MSSENTLQTLKDMKMDAGEVADRFTWGYEIVEVDDLKAEAVKWAKRMNKYEAIAWKKFFNLEDEDLK